ncbi:hypothetical protein AC1031_003574 [Aphanomyces cochlioides]|nr:hypothetical protein AC1031_003574 [Aphanomyces cochlioides]
MAVLHLTKLVHLIMRFMDHKHLRNVIHLTISQRSQIEEKEEERRFDGINFKAELKLKDTLNQRLEKARSLGIVKIRCTTWDEVYEYLWERYSRYFENLAICNRKEEGPIWSIKDGHPTMDEFPKRFSLRLETKQLKSFQNSTQRAFILKNKGETFTLSVYKYGNTLVSSPDMVQFEGQCLGPSEVDRAGAAAEEVIQDVMRTLRAEWGHLLVACSGVWRVCGYKS